MQRLNSRARLRVRRAEGVETPQEVRVQRRATAQTGKNILT